MTGAPIEALQRVPLFAELNRSEVKRIAAVFKERHFAAGETVVQQGSGGAAFYVIDSGEARVFVGGEERATLKAGDYFGELALIDEGAISPDLAIIDLHMPRMDGLALLQVASFYQTVITGAVLLVAVGFSRARDVLALSSFVRRRI